MILMVVAIGCGLVASYMTSKLIADRSGGQSQEEKVVLVVPKKDMGKWILIKKPEEMFELREWNKKDAPSDAIADLKALENKRLSGAIKGGLPITQRDLLNKDLDGLAAMIKPGSRAVGMKTTDAGSAGGFVLPGHLVDVICTQTRSETVSSVILQNMTVLAVDTIANRDPEKGITIVGSTITLAALPEEATRITLGETLGKLSLLLKASGDDSSLPRPPVTRPQDLLKPLRESKDKDREDFDDPRYGGNSGAATSGVLPPVAPPPDEARLPEEKPDVKPEVVAEDPVKVHRVTIIEGDYQRQEVFVWDKVENTWRKTNGRGYEEGGRREAPKPEAPKADAPKADAPKAEDPPKPAPERRAGSRTNN